MYILEIYKNNLNKKCFSLKIQAFNSNKMNKIKTKSDEVKKLSYIITEKNKVENELYESSDFFKRITVKSNYKILYFDENFFYSNKYKILNLIEEDFQIESIFNCSNNDCYYKNYFKSILSEYSNEGLYKINDFMKEINKKINKKYFKGRIKTIFNFKFNFDNNDYFQNIYKKIIDSIGNILNYNLENKSSFTFRQCIHKGNKQLNYITFNSKDILINEHDFEKIKNNIVHDKIYINNIYNQMKKEYFDYQSSILIDKYLNRFGIFYSFSIIDRFNSLLSLIFNQLNSIFSLNQISNSKISKITKEKSFLNKSISYKEKLNNYINKEYISINKFFLVKDATKYNKNDHENENENIDKIMLYTKELYDNEDYIKFNNFKTLFIGKDKKIYDRSLKDIKINNIKVRISRINEINHYNNTSCIFSNQDYTLKTFNRDISYVNNISNLYKSTINNNEKVDNDNIQRNEDIKIPIICNNQQLSFLFNSELKNKKEENNKMQIPFSKIINEKNIFMNKNDDEYLKFLIRNYYIVTPNEMYLFNIDFIISYDKGIKVIELEDDNDNIYNTFFDIIEEIYIKNNEKYSLIILIFIYKSVDSNNQIYERINTEILDYIKYKFPSSFFKYIISSITSYSKIINEILIENHNQILNSFREEDILLLDQSRFSNMYINESLLIKNSKMNFYKYVLNNLMTNMSS